MEFIEQPDRGGADLHIHSHFSDGSLSPGEILSRAEQANLSTISLTDHDTVEGVGEMLELARHSSIQVVPGVELSCQIQQGRYHILGYFINWEDPGFRKKLKYYEEQRILRVKRMVKMIREHMESNLSFEDVAAHSNRSLIGKPHVAKAMVDAGLVETIQQAFDDYLGEGKLLDEVPKERMGVSEAIRLIEDVGGVPVLAHPIHYDQPLSFQRFSHLGVRGIEVYYTDQPRTHQKDYFERAQDEDLLVTGGSDFHGEAKPDVSLGDIRLPEIFVDQLEAAARLSGARQDLLS